jgi:hypothetical protein
MGKITVQYFVNKELNPKIENGKPKYPVYVQVIALRKNLRFKSNNNLFYYLSDDDLKEEFVQGVLQKEKEYIESIVRDLIDKKQKNLITSKNICLFSKNLNDSIDDNFGKFLLQERNSTGGFIPSLLFASYREVNEVIYFFNDESPLTNISENIRLCLNAIQAIYKETEKGLFYVYDLFYGEKKERIMYMLNYISDSDEKKNEKMITILQKLVSL